jgi:hypothetical protein
VAHGQPVVVSWTEHKVCGILGGGSTGVFLCRYPRPFFTFLYTIHEGFPHGSYYDDKKGAQLHHPDPDRYRPAMVSDQNTDTVMPPPERVTCGARLSGLAERLTAAEKQLEKL